MTTCRVAPDAVLARARGRARAVRRVPARVPLHEGQRGFCFVRAREGGEVVLTTYGRSSGFCVDPIEKKPLNHFLPGHVGALVRHRGLQPRLQVLPELGHLEVARDRHAGRRRLAGGARRRGRPAGLPQRRLYLQRPGDLPRVRDRRRRRLSRARGPERWRSPPATSAPEPRGKLFATWTRPTSTSRRSPRASTTRSCAGHLQPVLETLEYLRARDGGLARDHDAADPGPQRFRRRDRRARRAGSPSSSGPTSRCTSPRSTPTGSCATAPTPAATLTRARATGLANGLRYVYTGNVHARRQARAPTAILRGAPDRARLVRARRRNLVDGRCRVRRALRGASSRNALGRWGAPTACPSGRGLREPVAAGSFYPRDPETLAATVDALLRRPTRRPCVASSSRTQAMSTPARWPRRRFALVPRPQRAWSRAVALRPARRRAVSGAEAWTTPLATPFGRSRCDAAARTARRAARLAVDDEAQCPTTRSKSSCPSRERWRRRRRAADPRRLRPTAAMSAQLSLRAPDASRWSPGTSATTSTWPGPESATARRPPCCSHWTQAASATT